MDRHELLTLAGATGHWLTQPPAFSVQVADTAVEIINKLVAELAAAKESQNA